MVEYKLLNKKNGVYIYKYFPEGIKTKTGGIIALDTNTKTVDVKIVAKTDFLRIITAEELNKLRESINELRKETGLATFTEEEWPMATKEVRRYYYASHVISVIWENFKKGTLQNQGRIAWG